jgi:hypothetical protein
LSEPNHGPGAGLKCIPNKEYMAILDMALAALSLTRAEKEEA